MIPDRVADVLPAIARAGDTFVPLDALRTPISQYGATLGFKPSHDVDDATLRDNAMSTCAVTPTLICALWRLRQGLEPVAPHPTLGYAANYLYMMLGTEPTEEHAAAVEKYLISTIDHGFNASTFTARVITSTGADLGAAVVGAIGALSGPLHGGAPSRALQMLDEIGTPDRAEPWLRAAVERGDRLMGFGHRVYKTDDPRSLMLRDVADNLGGDKMELARHIESDRGQGARRAEAGPPPLHERRVLRGHRHGPLRDPAGAVHADVRGEPHDRLVHPHPRAGGRQPADPPERAVRRAPSPAARPANLVTDYLPRDGLSPRRDRSRLPLSA